MNPEFQPGKLLLATPVMVDPNFAGTVVLLCEVNEKGIMGLILNRSLDVPLHEVAPDWKDHSPTSLPLSWGGPVGPDKLHGLHDGQGQDETTLSLVPGLSFGGLWESFALWHQAGHQIRFFLGYSGWDAGQLEEECEAGAWYIHPGSPETALQEGGEHLWHRLVGQVDPEHAWMRNLPDDPENN
jgi:putative transcriptional regulator